MTGRHSQRSTSDIETVTDSPAPQRRPKEPIGGGWTFVLILGGIVLALAVVGSIFGGDEDAPSPEQRLCDLLRGGWTTAQLIGNDQWQDWPDSQSPLSREIDLADAADQGGCFDLA